MSGCVDKHQPKNVNQSKIYIYYQLLSVEDIPSARDNSGFAGVQQA